MGYCSYISHTTENLRKTEICRSNLCLRHSATINVTTNKAGYTATLVACGWAGAVLEKVTRASGQEPYAQKAQKRRKSKKGTNRPTD